jgi:serine/threonine protein kinase
MAKGALQKTRTGKPALKL